MNGKSIRRTSYALSVYSLKIEGSGRRCTKNATHVRLAKPLEPEAIEVDGDVVGLDPDCSRMWRDRCWRIQIAFQNIAAGLSEADRETWVVVVVIPPAMALF